MDYLIYSHPRCSTKWISTFLSYGGWHCNHDYAAHLRTIEDIKSFVTIKNMGSVETAISPFWRAVPTNLKQVVIRRPYDEIIASMERAGVQLYEKEKFAKSMEYFDLKMRQIEKRVPNILSLTFADLRTESGVRALWEHVMPFQWNPEWYAIMSPINIQINMAYETQEYRAFEPQLKKLSKQVAHYIKTSMLMKRPDVDHKDGITIQEEDWHTFLKDVEPIARAHNVLIDEAPDYHHTTMNIPFAERLYEQGKLQILTARCNGKMFGYLMTIISETFEHKKPVAVHTLFYADPSFVGLGKRLQKEALNILHDKGIDTLHLRAGVRGDGNRVASLYKRIGAIDNGQLFTLDIP